MKKIAIFINDLHVGGIQKSIINILNAIDLTKYKIDLYIFDKDYFYENTIPNSVKIIFLPKSHFLYKFIPFKLACKIHRTNKLSKKYDIAIDFDSYQFDTAYSTIKCYAKRHIIWIHNDVLMEKKYNFKYRILHYFMKGKYRYFDDFVGVSNGVIQPFKKLNRIKNKNFYVIPNLINTNEIFLKCNEKIDDIYIDTNKYNLVSVGRICYQKGYDIFIKQFKKIIDIRKDIHFYLIGDGEEKNKLIKLAKKYEIYDYITFISKKTNPFKYENVMDGFVLTSRYEGQGMVILEALSLGLEIFISKNLEKYNNYNISGTDNLITEIINAKKKNKKRDDLSKYNNDIIRQLEDLLQ